MNNKGFTLIEILATVIILGLVMGLAVSGVGSVINNSKKKGEEIFVDKFRESIIEYLNLYGNTIGAMSGEVAFKKCKINDCDYSEGTYDDVTAVELSSLEVNDLIDKKILDKSSIVNPANKKECFSGVNPSIRIFKDSDFVYYFYVDLSGSNTTCELSDDNAIISNIPDDLADKVGV